MKLKPVSDHLILKPVDKETVTASGIIIPDTVEKEKPEQAKVLAVGPGKMLESGERQAMEVKAGDTVMFKKWSPDEVEVGGETFLIVKSDDIIAVVESES